MFSEKSEQARKTVENSLSQLKDYQSPLTNIMYPKWHLR